jgi:glycerol-3-phosphate dehydrogenase (NAD(P)+)
MHTAGWRRASPDFGLASAGCSLASAVSASHRLVATVHRRVSAVHRRVAASHRARAGSHRRYARFHRAARILPRGVSSAHRRFARTGARDSSALAIIARWTSRKGENMAQVAVLGGGSWGTTIAHLLGGNGHEVFLWLRDAAVRESINERHVNEKFTGKLPLSVNIHASGDLGECARASGVIFAAVPLRALREVAWRLGEFVTGDQIVISCAKGLEAATHKRPTEIVKEETCVKKVGCLSGPNLAVEILKGQPCASVLASPFREVCERGRELIMGPRFRVYESEDVLGVELAGALKNVIALGAGVTDGLGFGDNSKAALITRGLAEMQRYAVRMGADPLTFIGLAGVGDAIATCASPLSRNHQVGERLGRGEKLEAILASMTQTAEGVTTTRAIVRHAKELGIDMPLTEGIARILYEGARAEEVLVDLMRRPASREIELVPPHGSRA